MKFKVFPELEIPDFFVFYKFFVDIQAIYSSKSPILWITSWKWTQLYRAQIHSSFGSDHHPKICRAKQHVKTVQILF